MSADKQRIEKYIDGVIRQYNDVNALIVSGLAKKIPQEVAIELQHMLMHLLAMEDCSRGDYNLKTQELSNALGHVDRAFLDGCKVLVLDNFSSLTGNISFMREWAEVRQNECQGHSHRILIDSNIGRIPERSNPICERFKGIFIRHGLMRSPRAIPGAMPPQSTAYAWKRLVDFFPPVRCWLNLDLFYTTLRSKKHLEALQVLIICFMSFNKKRLERLNLQLMLETLAVGGEQAKILGWPKFEELRRHYPRFKDYIIRKPWQEHDFTAEQSWIVPLFNSLWKFYMHNNAIPLIQP